jgi:tol-pal system-associated acyl-CoA thioesterase
VTDYHTHEVRVYYEDTDLSGSVYHANYLKFFERAREHVIGPEVLRRLHEQRGLGFVVYEADLSFKRSAKLGDQLEVRTRVSRESDFRAIFEQDAYPLDGEDPYVESTIELVCVDENEDLVPLPDVV